MIAGAGSDEEGWALLGDYGNQAFASSASFQLTGDEIYNNLMIAKLTVRSVGNDELSMNFYETGTDSVSLTEPTSWDLSYQNAVSGTSSSIGISVQQYGGSGHIDELRIATEYGEAIPEPATLGLLGLGSLALSLRRRK
jgi:hypothetical protein